MLCDLEREEGFEWTERWLRGRHKWTAGGGGGFLSPRKSRGTSGHRHSVLVRYDSQGVRTSALPRVGCAVPFPWGVWLSF
jgi:hypothetical protein